MNLSTKKGILWSARVVHSERKRLEFVRLKAKKKNDLETAEECAIVDQALERVEEILKTEANKNGTLLPKVARRGS